MEGVVISIDTFFASGEIIPPVTEKDAVLVAQIDAEPHIGAASREHLEDSLIWGEHQVDGVAIVHRVAYVGVAWAGSNGEQG